MAFIFKVVTTGTSESFTIPCQNVGTFSANIDWGDAKPDSTITAYNDGDLAHTYDSAGTYTITITGTFPNIYFNNGGDKDKLIEVVDLGDVGWVNLARAFMGCSNLTAIGSTTANTSNVSDMQSVLDQCTSLLTADLRNWDVSSNGLIWAMFRACSSLTYVDVSGWDTLSITRAEYAFQSCSSLETVVGIGDWDTSAFTKIDSMFHQCPSLTSIPIEGWDVANVASAANFAALTTIPTAQYNQILENWSQQTVQSGVNIHFGNSTYSVSNSNPEVGQGHSLAQAGLDSPSEISAPLVSQEHSLTVVGIESTSEVSVPASAGEHSLVSTPTESGSEVSSPNATNVVGLDNLLAEDVSSASESSTTAVVQTHSLAANDTEAQSEVSTPTIGQVHDIFSGEVISTSEVSSPAITEIDSVDDLLAEDLSSASSTSLPVVAQEHALAANDVSSNSEVGSPNLGGGEPPPTPGKGGGVGFPGYFKKEEKLVDYIRDEQDIMDIVEMVVRSGVL